MFVLAVAKGYRRTSVCIRIAHADITATVHGFTTTAIGAARILKVTKFLHALILLVACQACTQHTSYMLPKDAEIAISDQFSDEKVLEIVEAVDAWQTASQGKLNLRVSIGGHGYMTITPAELPYPEIGLTTFAHEGPGHTYTGMDVAKLDEIEKEDGKPWFKATMMHELGHALGLPHSQTGLMQAEQIPVPVIDSDALARFNENYQ